MQTILYHAKLYVARGDFRSALCAEDGIIRAVGSDAEILALARPGCRRIDCEGPHRRPRLQRQPSAPHAAGADAL